MADSPALRAVIGLEPEEAVAFFRQKGYRIGFDHRDVWQREHQAAFTVAKAMQTDLLIDIRQAVDDAMTNGTTLATFRETLEPMLVKRGWWGRQMMTDPLTGETREVQLGSRRRLKVIYETNLRTAHAEGQWERIQDTKDFLPYLMYDHTPSRNERKEHAAWDGLILPADDPWWKDHYPVKAWGCKCAVIQIGDRQVERMGASVGRAPEESHTEYTNARTGETQRVPVGVDPAFNYPPGVRREALVDHLSELIERQENDLRSASVRALSGEPFTAWAQRPAGNWPIAILPAAILDNMAIKTDVVRLSSETLAKQEREHPDIGTDDYRHAQDALDYGEAIIESDKAVIFVLEEKDGFVSVVHATQSGKAAFLTSFRRLSKDEAKRSSEIRRLRKKARK
jgi:hypothetical protein